MPRAGDTSPEGLNIDMNEHPNTDTLVLKVGDGDCCNGDVFEARAKLAILARSELAVRLTFIRDSKGVLHLANSEFCENTTPIK